ncbi:MAG: LPS assembly lipoprotein LptE [Gammaproteobacteria bacterium]|nr:LPS assembly lipoprotein LptE [Gammaproteobacteria bacterium]
MWSQTRVFVLPVLLAALLMSSCGFQLRGKIELPPELTKIQVTGLDRNNALRRQLERILEANGVEIVQEATDEAARLSLTQYKREREILVVGTDGRVQEYRLISGVNAAFRAEGFEMPSTTVNVFRDFNYDPDDVLGKAEEEKQLREDMDDELSQLIIQRLGALVRQ